MFSDFSDISADLKGPKVKYKVHKTYTLSFQYTGPFYDGGQFENAVVKLTYGDYNGNTLSVKNR